MKKKVLSAFSLKKKEKKINQAFMYDLLHKIVRARDGERCLRCHKTQSLQLSHIYPKGRYKRMEFDPDNVKLLCVGCHLYWWHKNPIEAHEWLKSVISEKRLDRLKQRTMIVGGKYDLGLHMLFLKDELKKYERRD